MRPVEPPAIVEVDSERRYVNVSDSACTLLGYSREELLGMRIDDLSFPSGAHVDPMFDKYVDKGSMEGLFAVQRKDQQVLWIKFRAKIEDGRMIAHWTEYQLADAA